MDYFSPGCGYASVVAIYDNRTDADSAGWFSGPRGTDVHLDTPHECQRICRSVSGCAFFSFEIESGVPESRCYLKAAYSDPACAYSAPARGARAHARGWRARARMACESEHVGVLLR